MTDWQGWEVVCIERREEADHEDCRAIAAIGHRVANTLRMRNVDTVHAMIDAELSQFYVPDDGERDYLRPATHEGRLYVRTHETDDVDDPLLALPDCESYEDESR